MCDELDGRAARTFDQASTLGALLDMVTDRVATTGLLAILCAFYPAWSLAFLVLLMLDIFSHWFQMYSTLLAGSSTHKVRRPPGRPAPQGRLGCARGRCRWAGVRHKARMHPLQQRGRIPHRRDPAAGKGAAGRAAPPPAPVPQPRRHPVAPQDVKSRSLLVRTYYSNRIFMGFCCVCCEVEYLCLYLLHWARFQQLGLLPLSPALLQQLPPALVSALPPVAALQRLGGVPAVAVVALLALPGVAIKQTCNWLQLRTAAAGLVDYDTKRLAAAGKAA